MATPLTADRLVAALKAEGVRVVEHKSWRTNNRNAKGPWGPVNGVMLHHTVTKGTASTVALCYSGRSDLPGRCATASSPRTAPSTSSATAAPTTRARATTTC